MSELQSAVAAGVLGAEEDYRSLLRSVVDVARSIFRAEASSVFLLDEGTDELVFEAVSGEGAESLVGMRFPSSTGVAGWVLVTRQPLVLEDVGKDPRFGREAAESTGYVPKSLMAAPLLHGEDAVGVLEVLDRESDERFTLAEMQLLGLFANQAAIALDLLRRARAARASLQGAGEGSILAEIATALERDNLDDDRRATALRALEALRDLL